MPYNNPSMLEKDIDQLIMAFQHRIVQGEMLRTLTGNSDTSDDLMKKAIFNQDSTKTARSEYLIEFEQADSLVQKVRKIRLWFLQTSRKLRKDPAGDEVKDSENARQGIWKLGVGEFSIESDEDGEYFNLNYNRFALSAERKMRKNLDTNLLVIVDHPLAEIVLGFDFDYNYHINIIFNTSSPNPTQIHPRYSTSIRPVEEMTDEEYNLAEFYLQIVANHLTGRAIS